MTVDEVAGLLNVKRDTVYAYVSRGRLTRHTAEDGRRSVFDRAEVEALTRKARNVKHSVSLELVLESSITLLDPHGKLYYRGRDVAELARTESFEAVCDLLWQQSESGSWLSRADAVSVGSRVQAELLNLASPADRLRVIAAAVSSADPMRDDLRPESVAASGRAIIAAFVDCLPQNTSVPDDSIAGRLWSRLGTRQPREGELRALNGALISAADNEMPPSTLTARIAASRWANPYLAVLVGLATFTDLPPIVGAPVNVQLRGAATQSAEAFLRDISTPDGVGLAMATHLQRTGLLPGFGHYLYAGRDPRAEVVLDLSLSADGNPVAKSVIDRLLDVTLDRQGVFPNLAIGLAALTTTADFIPGSAEAIQLIGRTAGLIGHAMEEYEQNIRIRGRALYTGVNPHGRPRMDDAPPDD